MKILFPFSMIVLNAVVLMISPNPWSVFALLVFSGILIYEVVYAALL